MTTVINLKDTKRYDVYIARPSMWGNPFKISDGYTREECIEKYRDYVLSSPELMARLPELKGKVLGCWCKPLPCHGDILIELIDSASDEESQNQPKSGQQVLM